MEIKLNYANKDLLLVYDNNGILEHVINLKTNEKMMLEFNQVGTGYEMSKNNDFIPMDICKATYMRIMELDVFIPKFIFISNDKLKNDI